MNVAGLGDIIIETGICCYGSRQYRLFLCTSTFLPGTGDYESAVFCAGEGVPFLV